MSKQDKLVTFRTNKDIYKFLKGESSSDAAVKKLYDCIKKGCRKEPYSSDVSKQIMNFSEKVTHLLFGMLHDCGGKHDRFMKTHANWLNTNVQWPSCESVDLTAVFDQSQTDGNISQATTPRQRTNKNVNEIKKNKDEPVTNKDIYMLLKTENNLDFRKLNRWFEETCPSVLVSKHSKDITNFSVKYTQSLRKKLTECDSNHSIMMERHSRYLEDKFKWPSCLSEFASSKSTNQTDESKIDYEKDPVEMFKTNWDILKFLYNTEKETMNNYKLLFEHILENIPLGDGVEVEEVEDFARNITSKCFQIFAACNFDITAMEIQHMSWLKAKVNWPESIRAHLFPNTTMDTSTASEMSPPKQMKLDHKVVDDYSEIELALALVSKLVKSEATVSVIRDLVANPSLASEFQNFMRTRKPERKTIARNRRQ